MPGVAVAALASELRTLRLPPQAARAGSTPSESGTGTIRWLGFGTARDRARSRAAIQDIFPDVREADELAGLNMPGQGARCFLDGRAIGDVPEPGFTCAFFAIGLDPRSQAPARRVAPLGGEEAASR